MPQPAVTQLRYKINEGDSYVDIARDLSRINRRLYEQSRTYAIANVSWTYETKVPTAATDVTAVSLFAYTAGDSWIVQNSFTKAHALWKNMQKLVLKDNPSIKGKWHDFKIYLDAQMKTGTILDPLDGANNPVMIGEWNYSTFVMPQHEVDPATGEPLPAVEVEAHIVGDDSTSPLATGSTVSLVKAYGQSRATVQPIDPNVPSTMSDSFFNLLTDSGSQEPELADVIEDENDQPPYDDSYYPGGSVNAPTAWLQQKGYASQYSFQGNLPGFMAECGLIKFDLAAVDMNGDKVEVAPECELLITLVPGTYKGVASLPMGQ